MSRRELLAALALGMGVALAGCGRTAFSALGPEGPAGPGAEGEPPFPPVAGRPNSFQAAAASPAATTASLEAAPASTEAAPGRPKVVLGEIPPPHPGPAQVYYHSILPTHEIAITIDDGYCQECAKGYAEFATRTGTHITFSPNGAYHAIWDPLAPTLRPLIEAGQVQIGNHTYHHYSLEALSDSAAIEEVERNEKWIQKTFGVTARPWYRPPYGYYDERTNELVGSIGYTNVLMWNGTFGDSTLISPTVLMSLAERWLRPGTIMLGHANHPTVLGLFGPIMDLIAARGLKPVTLDEMFGTSRAVG